MPPSSEEFTKEWNLYSSRHNVDDNGQWVYYPWLNKWVRILNELEFKQLRSSRNKNKINVEEQNELEDKTVVVIGLSVGQSAAIALAMEGSVGTLRLVDFDELDLSNLNRLRAGVHQIGERKTRIAARSIAEIDPYLKTEIYEDGAQPENLDFLLEGADILLEECDSLPIKILARLRAREKGIPVIMDTSDRGMLDIERFDLESDRPLFHGNAGEINLETLNNLNKQSAMQLMMAIVDYPKVSDRLKESYAELGKSFVSWPQLASEVMSGGAHAAEAARRILLKEDIPSGRYYLGLSEIIHLH